MNELQIFKNSEFGEIRTDTKEGEPYFCLIDLCEILDIKNSRDCRSRLKEDGVVTTDIIDRMGRTQQATFVNESNLYKVIFQSRKESAEHFTEWVTAEVLPTIRKHGMYAVDELLENPDLLIKVATALKEEKERNKKLESEKSMLLVDNTIMKPKAEYFDELVDRNLLTNFRDTAKEFQIKEKDFIQFLIAKKFIYRDLKGKLMPYAEKNKGLFEVKEAVNRKTEWVGNQTLITPRGRETFRLLIVGM